MDLKVNWSRNDGVLIARPEGRIYSSNYLDWQGALEAGIDRDDTALVVDFEQVPYLSSAGLRVLLTIAKQFDQPGRSFAICQLPRTVRKVLSASGFDRVVTVYDTESEAVAAVTGGGADA